MPLIRHILCLVFILLAPQAFGLQIVEPIEGQNTFVKVSSLETTRVVIEGGKIQTLLATEGELSVEKDEDRGQVFIRPLIQNKAINVRIISASGSTYNLVLQAVDIPQEDIIIKEPFTSKTKALDNSKLATSQTNARIIKYLVSTMALDEPPTFADVKKTKQEFTLWENTKFIMTAIYYERSMVGEKFELTNMGKTTMKLVEQEFYRKGVLAVAIENHTLEPGQATNVYVLRGN